MNVGGGGGIMSLAFTNMGSCILRIWINNEGRNEVVTNYNECAYDTHVGSFSHKSTQIVEYALANPIRFPGRRDV
jgi:hypothetical protein